MSLVKKMEKSGQLDIRRKGRYRDRVSHLIRERLENKFWTIENKTILENTIRSIDSSIGAPIDIVNKLLNRNSNND